MPKLDVADVKATGNGTDTATTQGKNTLGVMRYTDSL